MIQNRPHGVPRCTPPKRVADAASLSVVIVASGTTDTSLRALGVLADVGAASAGQVILVSRETPDRRVESLIARRGAKMVLADPGSTRAEMCDLGMKDATGTVVAVRDDVDVGDGAWLSAFAALIPALGAPATADTDLANAFGAERVVMDTMVPVHAAADRSVLPLPRPDRLGDRQATIEMAATV